MKVYKDKIYNRLQNNDIRDRILKGRLDLNEYSNTDVYEFLMLLQQNNAIRNERNYKPITKEEWRHIIIKVKRQSRSSISSKRNYAMYKYRLESEVLTNILTRYYNTIVQKEFYPTYWLKVLDIMLDKDKGLIIGKLRTI